MKHTQKKNTHTHTYTHTQARKIASAWASDNLIVVVQQAIFLLFLFVPEVYTKQ